MWGAMFSTFDCAFVAIRGKEDPWNAISSGALTSGLLSARFGMRVSLQSAVFGVRLERKGMENERQRDRHLTTTVSFIPTTGLHFGVH